MIIAEETTLAQELGKVTVQFQKFGLSSDLNQDLNSSEFRLLVTIKYFMKSNPEGIKVSELSTYLEITPARVTHMINALEKDGYVQRLNASNDRRLVLIKPTEKGINITETMSNEFLIKFNDLVNYLGDTDTKELIRILKSTITFFKERRKYAKS